MLLLTLPVDSPAVQFCVNKFLWWAWWQSIVMILQNRRADQTRIVASQIYNRFPQSVLTAAIAVTCPFSSSCCSTVVVRTSDTRPPFFHIS